MFNIQTLKMAWSILDSREKRNAWIVLAVILLAALSASVMVASIMPFLSVLSDPELIHTNTLFKQAYEWGGFESDRVFLITLGHVSIVLIVVSNLIQVLRVYVVTRYATMRAHTISARLLSSYLRQPYSFFLENHSGDMGTRILSESQQVVLQFYRPAGEAIASLMTLAALLGLLLYAEPLTSIVVFTVFGGIYGGALLLTRKMIHRLGSERAKSNAMRYRIASEALAGVRDIKLLGREWSYLDRFQKPSIQMNSGMAIVTVISQVPQYVMQITAFSGLIILCLFLLEETSAASSNQAISEILPTIGLLAFAGQRMLPELSRLFASVTQLTYGDAAVRTVHSALATELSMLALPRKPVDTLPFVREMEFEAVGYRFPQGDKVGLSDISFRIRAGERIGVVGTTGAGKSTLANVLLGLLPPSTGRFLIDGQPVIPENVRAWQRNIGYVPQEIILLDASIRENIALGVSPNDIDDNKVRRAAKVAQIYDFISNELEQGFDTEVGERGVRLSGGQRQRIGIARALYEDPKFILLDEATSALDTPTERELMRAIEALPGDKTIVMIAHRLSTLKNCDRIMVMNLGKVIAFGAKEELLRDNEDFENLTFTAIST